jgi:pSer/pThr/pTyr-binding forkhead associated (FHA) protein
MSLTTVKTFLVAIASDRGPRLLAFRVSNLLIGRLPDNHLSLNHNSVSRRHAKIDVTSRGVFIEDLGSQNGTTVNGTVANGQTPVRPGDILRIGHVPVYYFGFIDPSSPPTVEDTEQGVKLNPMTPSIG